MVIDFSVLIMKIYLFIYLFILDITINSVCHNDNLNWQNLITVHYNPTRTVTFAFTLYGPSGKVHTDAGQTSLALSPGYPGWFI